MPGGYAAKLPRGQSVAALEQAIEVRDVAETGGKGDFRNGLVGGAGIKKLARACHNPLLINVFADRTACARKQTVHVALGAAKLGGQRYRAEIGIVTVT